ncbi:MAG TPA: hypothetical protein VI977_04265 [archaeon]|nr:hypothetical protein [archaeon]
MKKAFFFSIDATVGIAVVLIAIAALAMLYTSTAGTETKTFEAVKTTASDASIAGFYLKKNYDEINPLFSLQLQGPNELVSSDAKYYFCAQHFTYDPGSGDIATNVYCDVK